MPHLRSRRIVLIWREVSLHVARRSKRHHISAGLKEEKSEELNIACHTIGACVAKGYLLKVIWFASRHDHAPTRPLQNTGQKGYQGVKRHKRATQSTTRVRTPSATPSTRGR